MMKLTKLCPICGWPLVVRKAEETATPFKKPFELKDGILQRLEIQRGSFYAYCGCYPLCDHVEPVPEDVRLRLAGAPELPGFGEKRNA